MVSKDGGEWTTFLGGGITSPGFEINDAGFMLDADRIAMTTGVGRRWVTPGRTFRSFSIDAVLRQELNFGGVNIRRAANLSVNGTLNNLWNFNVFGTLQRGGIERPGHARWAAPGPAGGRAAATHASGPTTGRPFR